MSCSCGSGNVLLTTHQGEFDDFKSLFGMFSVNGFNSMPVVRENAMFVLLFCVEGRVEGSVVGFADEGLEGIVVFGDGVGEGERGSEGEGEGEDGGKVETHCGWYFRSWLEGQFVGRV